MQEFPESTLLAKQIEQNLKGKEIEKIEVLKSLHKFAFFKGDRETYEEQLIGEHIERAMPQGGLLELQTEHTMMFFGDGASPKYYEDKKKFPKKHQLLLEFTDGTAIAVSIQMYGEIGIYPIGTCEDGYYVSSSTKPNPLSPEFTYEYFKSLYHPVKKMSAKAFLATEQRIPGLGNGVLQDILWEAGIDPRFDMKKATEEDLKALYDAVKTILEKMCREGGRNTEKDLFGNPCGYVTQMSKNSLFEPCMKCGNEISKANYMGGTIYVCEHCQKR